MKTCCSNDNDDSDIVDLSFLSYLFIYLLDLFMNIYIKTMNATADV